MNQDDKLVLKGEVSKNHINLNSFIELLEDISKGLSGNALKNQKTQEYKEDLKHLKQEEEMTRNKVKEKRNKIKILEKEEEYIKKLQTDTKKLYNSLNKRESNLTKLTSNYTSRLKGEEKKRTGTLREIIEKEKKEKIKQQKRADIIYGDDEAYWKKYYKNGEKEYSLTDKEIIDYDILIKKKLNNISNTNSFNKFFEFLNFILECEGGYNNYKQDKPTNFGITQYIYNVYRKDNGQKIQDIKLIKKEEAIIIYYEYFWIPSKAELLDYPLSLVYFDMYVNSNPKDAKNVLKRSNNNIKQFIENRRKFYNDIVKIHPEKKIFLKGWNNRLDKLQKYIDEHNE